MLVLFLSDHIQ